MEHNHRFKYKDHVVQIYITALGKKWTWEWDTDQGAKGQLTGDSGASSKESALSEAKSHAKAHLDNLTK